MAIKVTPEEFAKDIQRRGRKLPDEIKKGLFIGATFGVNILKGRTPEGVSNQLKRRWRVRRRQGIPLIENNAPYAGVIEEGARPHPVSQKGILSIARWARGKLGMKPKEARSFAYAVANKIRREGAKPTYFVRDSIDDIRDVTALAVRGQIKRQANRKA